MYATVVDINALYTYCFVQSKTTLIVYENTVHELEALALCFKNAVFLRLDVIIGIWGGRGGSDALISQGMPRMADEH